LLLKWRYEFDYARVEADRTGAWISRRSQAFRGLDRRMQKRALVLEAHYTTHIEGTQLTLEKSERILAGSSFNPSVPA
jgi:hypothetical protein